MFLANIRFIVGSIFCVVILSSCTSLRSEIDPPKVSLESFRHLESDSGAPRFEMQVRIANPNKTELDIVGIAYGVEILGRELVSGVTNEVPVIEPYGDAVVTLEAGLQLFQIVRLLTSLGTTSAETLEYSFSAKIDFRGLVPTQRISEKGEINLGSPTGENLLGNDIVTP